MQHECLQCHQRVELPEGHRLIVCPVCGAAQDRFKQSQTQLPPPKLVGSEVSEAVPSERKITYCSACNGVVSKAAPTCPHCGQPDPWKAIVATSATATPQKSPRRRSGIPAWAIIAGVILVGGFLVGISAPSYNAYTQKLAPRATPAITTNVSDLQSTSLALKELVVHTDAFNRELQRMQYTEHVNLPALSRRMKAIMDDAATVKVPQCASKVKDQMTLFMTHGQAAVESNYAAGQGMNYPSVIMEIRNATRAVEKAQIEATRMKC